MSKTLSLGVSALIIQAALASCVPLVAGGCSASALELEKNLAVVEGLARVAKDMGVEARIQFEVQDAEVYEKAAFGATLPLKVSGDLTVIPARSPSYQWDEPTPEVPTDPQ